MRAKSVGVLSHPSSRILMYVSERIYCGVFKLVDILNLKEV